jgi:hypothetical protein
VLWNVAWFFHGRLALIRQLYATPRALHEYLLYDNLPDIAGAYRLLAARPNIDPSLDWHSG